MLFTTLIARLAIALIALAQAPPPQVPERPRLLGTGAIVGRVVDGANDQRIAGALVFLYGFDLPGGLKTITDGDGQFVFTELRPGSYTINVKRGGYGDGAYGQRRAGGPGRELELARDERRSDVTVRMFQSSAILGTVTDDVGEPVVKSRVVAYIRVTMRAIPMLLAVGEGLTDDRGMYRIGRLNPGDYVISVPMPSATPMMAGATSMGMIRDGGGSNSHLPPSNGKVQKFPTTYYPAGATAREATVVALGVGDVRRNIDIQVRPQRVVNINGKIVAETGSPRGVQLALIAAGEDEIMGDRSAATAVTGDSGSFAFAAIPPGTYILRARARNAAGADPRPAQWADQILAVEDRDLNDVTLYLRNGLRVNGTIEVEGVAPSQRPVVKLMPTSLGPLASPPPSPVADPTGRGFGFSDVLPGQYVLDITAPAGYAVKSVTMMGRELPSRALTVTASDVGGLTVKLTDHPSVVTGHVSAAVDTTGGSVLVYADDRLSPDPTVAREPLQFTMLTATGSFEIRGLPAGDYLLVAVAGGTNPDWLDPGFAEEAAQKGRRLHLSAGEQQVLDLIAVILR